MANFRIHLALALALASSASLSGESEEVFPDRLVLPDEFKELDQGAGAIPYYLKDSKLFLISPRGSSQFWCAIPSDSSLVEDWNKVEYINQRTSFDELPDAVYHIPPEEVSELIVEVSELTEGGEDE